MKGIKKAETSRIIKHLRKLEDLCGVKETPRDEVAGRFRVRGIIEQ